ncbi:MAG: helix-turn-helix transcriptional regulator [Lentisphaerae bacterium]|nr:helix-turn-helix transcriptional regulator [Lentisphaerota bacterium]
MSSKYLNFGDFITKKRAEHKITLREMAKRLGFSAPFLSDVEKDRRNPFDNDRLEIIAGIFELNEEERAMMYDLAGKRRNSVAPDLPDYIMERDYVSAALRTARDLDAGEAEWLKFVEELKKREE